MPRKKNPDTADAIEQLAQLEKVVDWMIRHQIVRLNLHGRAEIELAPSALLPSLRPIPNEEAMAGVKPHPFGDESGDVDPADLCGCGHSLSVLHSAAGCLSGCELDLCIPSASDDETA